jgi:arabinan endo-1,5-alpha-L-arabinosidase
MRSTAASRISAPGQADPAPGLAGPGRLGRRLAGGGEGGAGRRTKRTCRRQRGHRRCKAGPPLAVRRQRRRPAPAVARDFASRAWPAWQWVRPAPPAPGAPAARAWRWSTQPGDLYVDTNTAPLLARALPPAGDLRIETRVRLDAPDDCCATHGAGRPGGAEGRRQLRQAGRAGRRRPAPGGIRQGSWRRSPPATPATATRWPARRANGAWTWLRLDVRRDAGGGERAGHAWSSQDGRDWVKAAAPGPPAGRRPRASGLVAMGGGGRAVTFFPVTVSALLSPHAAAAGTRRAPGIQAGRVPR